tara:strand:- start:848 stop:2173 length:1326 start_codon:yes stop_codon:yes gene_type:complete
MALKSSSPLNLAALRQDYSMLPKIAAVKAKSSQQFLNAVTSGLEKRKERIEKKELNEAAKKMIEPLLSKPEFQARFGANAKVDEVLKLIGDPRKAVELANNVLQAEREFEDRERRIKREIQTYTIGQQQIEKEKKSILGDKAFSDAIIGISQNKDYQLAAEQANLMAPNQIQDFLDIKTKQAPDEIGTIDLGNGAYAITSNGQYKGMFTVPQDPKNALTARLREIEGLRGYFKEVEELFKNGRNTEAIQLLQALDVRVGNERVSSDDVDSAKAIVGMNIENLETKAEGTGGETGDSKVKIISIDGKDVSGQEEPEAEPEPAAEEAPPAPVEQQREVSVDEKGSIYDESGMPKSFVLRGLSKILPNIVKEGSPAAQKIKQETLQQIQSMASNVPKERIREQIVALERRKRRFALSPEEEAKVNQELQALNSMLGEGTALASK